MELGGPNIPLDELYHNTRGFIPSRWVQAHPPNLLNVLSFIHVQVLFE